MTRESSRPVRVPVTVITGFLGAGKTTLLDRILREPQRERYAVLINEFSDLGIDADLVVRTDEEIVELSNGCVCCSIRNDLIGALAALGRKRHTFGALLIETSGVSDPVAVAHTVLLEETHRFEGLSLDGIVTVVDASNVVEQLANSPTAQNQIALADVLLLNKTDLVGAEQMPALRALLAGVNRSAVLLESRRCEVPLAQLLGRAAYSLEQASIPLFQPLSVAHANTWDRAPIVSVALRSSRPLDPDDFLEWMSRLHRTRQADLLRAKGVVAFVDEPRKFVFHGVMGVMDGDAQQPWGRDEPRDTRVVFIGRDLDADALRQAFEACQR